MYEDPMYEKISAMNARNLLDSIRYRNEIQKYLGRTDLTETSRTMMEEQLEKANYSVKMNSELRIGLSEYLRQTEKKPVVFAEANQKRLEAVLTAAD